MAYQIKTEININASPQHVWEVLMDFSQYPQWNPFIQEISGQAQPGSYLKAKIVPQGSKGMIFKPKVTELVPFKSFKWLGHLWFNGLFDGEHIFELIDNGNGSLTFVQRENFKGILVPLFKKQLEAGTRAGFEAMNKKLKEMSEK